MIAPSLKWHDKQFKSENLALYSEEAERRAHQLKDVSYCMLLNLSDSAESGYEGTFRATFGLNEMPSEDKPLFFDF